MPIVDYAALPEFAMREGISGKWLCSREQGAASVSILSNTVQPGASAPRHRHDHEEIILVQEGRLWVAFDGKRIEARPGQAVIIPPAGVHAWGNDSAEIARVIFTWPMLDPFAPGVSAYLDGEPPAVR